MRHAVKSLLVLAIVAALTACGFQLRGKADLPPQMARTHIAGIPPGDGLGRELTRMLADNGVEIVATPEAATAVLSVSRLDFRQRVLAVDTAGRAREFELALTATFRAAGRGNEFELGEQTLTVTRTLLHDAANVLGDADERAVATEDMQRDLARLILYRLAAAR